MNKKELIERIDNLNAQIKEAKRKYIEEHAPFKVGDVIELNDMQGIIEGITLNACCEFEGDWRKFKKDGTMFTNSNHLYWYQLAKAKKVSQLS